MTPSLSIETTDLRISAREAFDAMAWPLREDEAARRTDLSSFDLARVCNGVPPSWTPAEFLSASQPSPRAGEFVLQGGAARSHLSDDLARRGVVLCDIQEALQRCPEKIQPYLGRAVPAGSSKFAALNTARFSAGCFLFVPKGVEVPAPFVIGFGPGTGRVAFPRVLLVLEEGAKATYMEELTAPAAAGEFLSSAVVELFLGAGSKLNYAHAQRWPRGWWHFSNQYAVLGRDASLSTWVAATGAGFSRSDWGSSLVAPGAESRLCGLVFVDGNQRMVHTTRQDHRAPRTVSDVIFKAAAKDRARSVYTGLVRIDPSAGQSNAYQLSKNILLSKDARADAIPTLEILTDDVKCGHGAAVGHLDDDQRFYLMSRGLNRAEAEQVMVEGFFEDALQRDSGSAAIHALRAALDEKWTSIRAA